ETAPEEADETETPNTEEVAQGASAEETGTNQIANDFDEGTGSSQVSGNAAGETETSGGEAADATDPDSDAEPSGDGDTSGSQPQDAETPEDGENQPDDSENGDSDSEGNQQDEEGTTSEEGDNSAGEDTEEPRKQIYDTDGNLIALPDSVSTIVAAGEAALITQMLGGEGVLLGSSSDFLGNTLVQSVFADEGIAEVASLWSGDGSSAMSDESFAQLLELNPDCVLEISGETNFSSDQETQLKEAQIYIVTLSALTSSNNIDAAVETVGQLLDDHAVGDTTSVELAEEYVAYESDLVTEVQSRKGAFQFGLGTATGSSFNAYFTNISKTISKGDYTMILYDWDDSFSFTYSYNGTTYVSQSSGAVVDRNAVSNPASYYMTVAGVMNTAPFHVTTEEEYTVYIPFYTLYASSLTDEDQNQDGVCVSSGFGALGPFATGEVGYSVSGDIDYGDFTIASSSYIISGYSMWAGLGHTAQLSSSPWYVSGDYAWLGTSRFPYVIAANAELASKLETEKADAGSLYAIRTWGIEVDGMNISIAANLTGQRSLVVNRYTTQRQDYDIVVNPFGCGDWLTGSVESVLESVWISNLYWGDETYSDTAMEEEIREFYETFYRHSLSSSELSDILDGE
ncbi:MAG: hypothetical protein LUG54_01815, partial [Clostridiales bacterium]|nr:hypothetical protein [Clostridiales bacterium]